MKREREIWDRHVYGERTQTTFTEAVEVYLRDGGDPSGLKKIHAYFGKWKLKDINQKAIDEAARKVYPNVKNSTLKRHFYAPLSAILHKAAEHDMCSYIRIKRPKVKPTPVKWATPQYFEIFWPYCNKHLRIITNFLPYTGCRITEVLNLKWSDVDLDKRTAFIEKTKTGVSRTVYLPEPALEALLELDHRQGRVFNMYKAKDAVNRAIRRTVDRINCDIRQHNIHHPEEPKEELEYLSSHKLGSHTYATWMMRYSGLNARQLMGTGRWKDINSVIRYTHTVASEEGRKADLLPRVGVKNP